MCEIFLFLIKKALHTETKAWELERNARQKGVNWQFTKQDDRIKLKRFYPQIQM